MRDFEEFQRASRSGKIVLGELLQFDDVNTFRAIIAASIETWCEANHYNALEVIATIDDAMHFANQDDAHI